MYSKPEWSEPTLSDGTLEVLKDGKIVEVIPIPLGKQSFFIGRHPENDLVLDHESVSRKHAVIQFGPNNSAFLYDLGSTHGTFLNKTKIPSSQFVKILNENSLFYFGASTRRFILHLESTKSTLCTGTDERIKFRKIMESFFSQNSAEMTEINFIESNGSTMCSFDYSSFLESEETLIISASGISRDDALLNFFEDSYMTLKRLDLIVDSALLDDNSELEESDSGSDIDLKLRTKDATKTLSEDDLVRLVDSFNNSISHLKSEISKKKSELVNLEINKAEDFDLYIQNLQKQELENDIEKLQKELNSAEKELERYKNILRLIGAEIPETDQKAEVIPEVSRNIRPITKGDVQSVKKIVKSAKIEKAEEKFNTDSSDECDKDALDFDDNEVSSAELLDNMKRKYGY